MDRKVTYYGDDKEDNEIEQEFIDTDGSRKKRLVSIDREQAFVEPLVSESYSFGPSLKAQLKSIVFCFPQMLDAPDADAIMLFTRLDPYVILKTCAENLELFYQGAIGTQVSPGLFRKMAGKWSEQTDQKECVIPIILKKWAMTGIYERIRRIQAAFNDPKHPVKTHLELVALIEPRLAGFYEEAHQQPGPPNHVFSALKSNYKIIRKESHHIIRQSMLNKHEETKCTITEPVLAEKEDINTALKMDKIYSPKMALEEELEIIDEQYRTKSLILSELIQGRTAAFENASPYIQEEILKRVDFDQIQFDDERSRQIFELRILNGLKKSKTLKILTLKNCHALTSDTGLLKKEILENNKDIQVMNFSGCLNLTGNIGEILENCSGLERIDLSGTGIETLNGSWGSSAHLPRLKRLTVNNCKNLKAIDINSRAISHFQADGCGKLETLSGNFLKSKKLQRASFAGCIKLPIKIVLMILENQQALMQLDLSDYPKLKADDICYIAQNCPLLQELSIRNFSSAIKLDQIYFLELYKLDISDSIISELDIQAPKLETIENNGCHLVYVRSDSYKLKSLQLEGKVTLVLENATEFDVSNSSDIIELEIQTPRLKKLEAKNCVQLEKLKIDSTKLQHLNLAGCSKLVFDPYNLDDLRYLNVSDCPITNLSIPSRELYTLILENCPLALLWISSPKIQQLKLKGKIGIVLDAATDLDISGSEVVELEIEAPQLRKLEEKDCVQLEKLKTNSKNLQHLNLGGCARLDFNAEEFGELRYLNVSHCLVSVLRINSQKIQRLGLSGKMKLVLDVAAELDISGSEIFQLEIEAPRLKIFLAKECMFLTSVHLSNKTIEQIQTLNLSGCVNLINICCDYMSTSLWDCFPELRKLDVSNSLIYRLRINSPRLEFLCALNCVKLSELHTNSSEIRYLNVAGCEKLNLLSLLYGFKNLIHLENECIELPEGIKNNFNVMQRKNVKNVIFLEFITTKLIRILENSKPHSVRVFAAEVLARLDIKSPEIIKFLKTDASSGAPYVDIELLDPVSPDDIVVLIEGLEKNPSSFFQYNISLIKEMSKWNAKELVKELECYELAQRPALKILFSLGKFFENNCDYCDYCDYGGGAIAFLFVHLSEKLPNLASVLTNLLGNAEDSNIRYYIVRVF